MSNSSDYQDLVSQIFRKFDQYGLDTLGDHQIDVDLLKALSKLIADRRNASSLLNDEEYLQKKLQSIQTGGEETEEVCYSDDTIKRDILVNMCRALGDDESNETARKDSLFYMYLTFRKYEIVMKEILEGFNCDRKINTRNLDVARVILLVLMFYLNESNMNKVKQVLLKFNAFLTKEIVGFLSLHDIKETMCNYLDREYVDDVLEVRTTQELLQKLQDEMVEIDEQSEEKSEIPRFVCKPFKTNYVRPATKSTPMPSEGEGDQNFVFKANPIPYDILNVDEEEMLRKKEKRLKKREIEARKLLEEANKKQFKCARNIGKKKDTKFDETMKFKAKKIKAKEVQKFPPVEIKTNAAQTLREAANIIKQEDQFEKMIQNLANGSLCSYEYEKYIDELRRQREAEELENIERKKLQALITHEEAILAKKRLIEKNKREKREFCKQWEEYERQMNEMKEKEMEELKLTFFVDTKQREKNIQDKMRDMLDEKCRHVQEENRKVKEDQERKMKELTEEIERKKELVHQIRFLQEIAKINNENRVRFDETEVMNNGFMYEMSLAELKQRLYDMEIEMKEELERRKCEILDEKAKKQKFLEETARLVEDSRNAKREMKNWQKEMKSQTALKKCPSSTANMDLKMKLMQIRQERLAYECQMKCTST
ncbi:hypothetical protein M8J76_003413 [Diaphorina citri]|nr:hypothetical protein M8J76_003413 [Diaphorina citri]